ncbi:MAG: hypothetical protein NW201_00490 [Gemmatimonadales bacterium]|nr:hypothetical protein [Gemmatimonadales bacterium]
MIGLLLFSAGVYGVQYLTAQAVAGLAGHDTAAAKWVTWGAGVLLSLAAIRGASVNPSAADDPPRPVPAAQS